MVNVDVLEAQPWKTVGNMEVREKGGWKHQVYELDGKVQACIISPDGTSRTYG